MVKQHSFTLAPEGASGLGQAMAHVRDSIRVNMLTPGGIATPLTQNLHNDPARGAANLSQTPMTRWSKSQDLIGPARFLVPEQAGFITGPILNVDSGQAAI
ncbi:conserved hypothetical protein [Rhodobacteraceae bacterium KLH11]|nr:conserved hypothetical protein [Rhodobacteraceae bacterium KLH11]